MPQSTPEESVVYLLKRKSDSEPYVGITLKRRLKQRMGDHKRSKRFKGIGFDCEILEESIDRSYIEKQEEYWIRKLDTYNKGLNESPSGKGWGHNSPNFTTLGFTFSDTSRKKMSESAKKRAVEEGSEVRSQRSKDNWNHPEYRAKQTQIRKGKRLRPPKISDEQVIQMRAHYEKEKKECIREIQEYNDTAKKRGWSLKTSSSHFARKYSDFYNCSNVAIKGIIEWKTRTKILPPLYGKD